MYVTASPIGWLPDESPDQKMEYGRLPEDYLRSRFVRAITDNGLMFHITKSGIPFKHQANSLELVFDAQAREAFERVRKMTASLKRAGANDG